MIFTDTTTLTPSPSPSPTPSSTPFPSPSPTPSPTPTPSQCFNTGQVVLQHYSTAYFFNSSVYITGQVSICFDGQYIPICNRPFEYSLFPQVCAVYTKNPESGKNNHFINRKYMSFVFSTLAWTNIGQLL